jgi:two-component system sensor kinase
MKKRNAAVSSAGPVEGSAVKKMAKTFFSTLENHRKARDEGGGKAAARAYHKLASSGSRSNDIYTQLQDSVVCASLDGRVIYWNDEATVIYGWTAEEMIGESVIKLHPPSLAQRNLRRVRRCLEDGKDFTGELQELHKDGRKIWVQIRVSPLRDKAGVVNGFVGTAREITKRKELEAELRRTTRHLRKVATSSVRVREDERSSLAREIHDVLAQDLTCAKIELFRVVREMRLQGVDGTIKEGIDRVTRLIDTVAETVQKIATDLRPVMLDTLGFAPAMEWLVADFTVKTGIACKITLPKSIPDLPRERAMALFRILQESLTNVARHAGAKNVSAKLTAEHGRMVLVISDDGRGIKAGEISSSESIGLLGMQERAQAGGGSVRVHRRRGGGTQVIACV